MMDFHILIVITCVFLASLFSLLFINKFFRRKTFEEIIAEKKAMTDKIYGQAKSATKKPKKLQQLKKEQKREKKQRQKEQQRDSNGQEQEQDDSDAQSEHASIDDEPPQGLSKTHVEFEPEPEILTYNNNVENAPLRRASNTDKENINAVANPTISNKQSKSKKDKKGGKSGILINKNEPVAIKDNTVEEQQLNHFEIKQPKDVVELKKQEKESKIKDEKSSTQAKKEKANKREKQVVDQPVIEVINIAKEIKQLDDKLVRQGSPKNQQNNSNKINSKTKKQQKETAATRELVVALDKLSETDTIGVSLLMNLFRRAELNRSEIQILIDYLLNKQQDMPSSHSEWSDDICQKLKRQLEEKEKALIEEQEASMGIQAKLRDLRTEVNTERAQMNANIKAYMEKLQSKEQELTALNQELQTLNDKIALERQQFQAKLIREKQTGSQDMLAQMQLMQNELAHKDKCITELTCMMNASHQAVEDSQQKTSELIQTQVQQIRALEQQRDELEQISNNRVFELEQAKTLESENAESKVEIRNLQNALESAKADLFQARKDMETISSELAQARNAELQEKQNEIQVLRAKNAELTQHIAGISNKTQEQSKEQSGLQVSLDALKAQVAEKERELVALNLKNSELKQELNAAQGTNQQRENELKQNLNLLKTEVSDKTKKLLEFEQTTQSYTLKEKEMIQQLQEQKEKNNQQQQLLAAAQKSITTATRTTDPPKDQKQIHELFQRLYPDAVKACAGTALSLSFDQWIEQVLATHIKQSIATTTSSSHKSTQSINSSNNHKNHNNTEQNNSAQPSAAANNDGGTIDPSEVHKLRTQNAQLRTNIDELTKLVKKTGNTLSELENRAREQEENWRRIVRSKDEQINTLQHSNGEQNI